jgi:hypothetical protein
MAIRQSIRLTAKPKAAAATVSAQPLIKNEFVASRVTTA